MKIHPLEHESPLHPKCSNLRWTSISIGLAWPNDTDLLRFLFKLIDQKMCLIYSSPGSIIMAGTMLIDLKIELN